MPNVTISMDEKTLKASREYAKQHGMSLHSLIREMLKSRVSRKGIDWVDECFDRMDRLNASSNGKRWSRDELYDV